MALKVVLPECGRWEASFHLTEAERRELVQRIAQEGLSAIDAYVREKEGSDSSIAAKINRIRQELVARAEALKRRLTDEYDEKERDATERFRKQQEQLARLSREEQERLSTMGREHDERLRLRLASDPIGRLVLGKAEHEKLPWHTRLLFHARRLLRRIGRALRRLVLAFLSLFGLYKRVPKRTRTVTWDAEGLPPGVARHLEETLLLHPDLRQRLKEQGFAEKRGLAARFRDWLLGRSDYEALAQRAYEDEKRRFEEDEKRKEDAHRKRIDELAREASNAEDAAEAEKRRLREQREKELAELARKVRHEPEARLAEEIVEGLVEGGMLRRGPGGIAVSHRLVERYASLLYAHETAKLGGTRPTVIGSYVEGQGYFRKEPLLSVLEMSHMDLVGSVVNARLRHPKQRHIYDDDVLVYRESRSARTHVAVIFDTSLSMEENQRLDAAKRALLVLWQAVKRDAWRNRVDLIQMHTSVRRVDLLDLWEAKPGGFTNTGAALKLAGELLSRGSADRRLLYLITDGLPEAYTREGVDAPAHPDKCIPYALAEAKKLARLADLEFTTLLLEPEDPLFVEAAERIAAVLEGRVVATDPEKLVAELYLDYDALSAARERKEPVTA